MSLDTDPDKSDGCCGGGPGEGRDEEHYWVGDRSPQQVKKRIEDRLNRFRASA